MKLAIVFLCFLATSLLTPGPVTANSTVTAPIAQTQEAEIVGRYLQAARSQQSALRGVSMEVDIDASVPKLRKHGKLRALRNISKLGKITYRMLGFNGDTSIKKDVIARYLAAEVQAQGETNISITPENYKFKLKGKESHEGHEHYVLSLTPRKKAVGLFRGEIWLDQETFMPVRESGRFVKSPSVFLTRMDFVRTYEMQNGVSIPQRVESRVATRIFGEVALTIDFSNFAKDPESEAASFASTNETQN